MKVVVDHRWRPSDSALTTSLALLRTSRETTSSPMTTVIERDIAWGVCLSAWWREERGREGERRREEKRRKKKRGEEKKARSSCCGGRPLEAKEKERKKKTLSLSTFDFLACSSNR